MENKRCFFCDVNYAKYESINKGKIEFYSCPTCGKYYLVADSIRQLNNDDSVKGFNNDDSAKEYITYLLSERNVHKKPPIIISSSVSEKVKNLLENAEVKNLLKNAEIITIDDLLKTYPQDALEMTERILLSLATYAPVPFRQLQMNQLSYRAFFCRSYDQLIGVLKYCESAGWVKNDPSRSGQSINGFFLITPRGWERINGLRKRLPGEKPQIFVAMWFSEKVEETYNAIKETVETTCQLKICRIDEKEYNGNICDEMFAEIQRSSAMIADYTGNRPNVYYEAGYAKGLGIPVIMLIRKSDLEDEQMKPHFDIAQYNFIVYENSEDLQKHLYQRLRSMFPQIP